MTKTSLGIATHSFAGYDVIANDDGTIAVMVPHRNSEGKRFFVAEGAFKSRRELADYCHGKLMTWMNV